MSFSDANEQLKTSNNIYKYMQIYSQNSGGNFMAYEGFVTPEKFDELKNKKHSGPLGWLLFVDCDDFSNGNPTLAENVKSIYEKNLSRFGSSYVKIPIIKAFNGKDNEVLIKVFEDTETCPTLPEHVAGANVYIFFSVLELKSGRTENENLVRLLQVIRTLKVNKAKNITVITPYFPYARQDKPTTFKREATLGKLVADMLYVSGADEIIIYHPHSESIRGFFEPKMRVTVINGLDLFKEIFQKFSGNNEVFAISPDAGGAKAAVHLAKAIKVSYAIGNKFRPEKDKSDALGVIGNLKGKKIALLSDDESSTFSTLYNVTERLYKDHDIKEIYGALSHMKLRQKHIPLLIEAHEKLGLKELHITDSVPQTEDILNLPFIKVHSLAEPIALAINSMHYNQSVSSIFYMPKK
jgi:ribose-phosphate pyrophosphokinase